MIRSVFGGLASLALCCADTCGQSGEGALPAAARPILPCGAEALAIATKIVGGSIPNDALDSAVREDGSSSFADLRRVAQSHGLFAVPVQLNAAQLARLPHVAILQLVMRPRLDRPWQEHFTVYAGPGRSRGNVCIFDPIAELGRGDYPLKILADKWTGAALLLSPSPIDLKAIGDVQPRASWPSHAKGALLGASATWLSFGAWRLVRKRRCIAGTP